VTKIGHLGEEDDSGGIKSMDTSATTVKRAASSKNLIKGVYGQSERGASFLNFFSGSDRNEHSLRSAFDLV